MGEQYQGKKRRGRTASLPLLFKEALIKSTYADLRQKFPLSRKKTAGILTDFKVFFGAPAKSQISWGEEEQTERSEACPQGGIHTVQFVLT